MKHAPRSILFQLRTFIADQSGQSLAMIAVGMTMIVSVAALAIDMGHARYTYRELQQVTDSAALAAAPFLPLPLPVRSPARPPSRPATPQSTQMASPQNIAQ